MGRAERVDVTVTWPSGLVQRLDDMVVNQRVQIVEDAATTAVDQLPVTTVLAVSCYPNPFNPCTTFQLSLPRDASVDLQVIDARGRLVRTLYSDEPLSAGVHRVQWLGRADTGRATASGVYFYRCVAAGEVVTGRMVLLK